MRNIDNNNIEDVYPLSEIQKGMIYHSIADEESKMFHCQTFLEFQRQDFDPKHIIEAFDILIKKHPILRTGINIYNNDKPFQIVYKQVKADIKVINWETQTEDERKRSFETLIEIDKKLGFKFNGTELLWRISICKINQDKYLYFFSNHHAIIDGWSSASLINELIQIYTAKQNNVSFNEIKLKNTYKEYVIQELIDLRNENNLKFWIEELKDYDKPLFHESIIHSSPRNDSKVLSIDTNDLLYFEKQYNISIKSIFLSGFVILMKLLSFHNDILFGVISHNRPACEDSEKILGCFLNTIPFRIHVPEHCNWLNLLKVINNKLNELLVYSKVPFSKIQTEYQKDYPNKQLIQAIFNFTNFHVLDIKSERKSTGEKSDESKSYFKIDSSVNINTVLNFNVDIFNGIKVFINHQLNVSDGFIKILLECYENILKNIILYPKEAVNQNKIIVDNWKIKYPPIEIAFEQKTILDSFNKVVQEHPNKIALILNNLQLTYKQLDEKSNQLTNFLIHEKIPEQTIIGILVNNEIDKIIAILSLIKGNYVYLPIERNIPKERLEKIILDSNLSEVIVDDYTMMEYNRQLFEIKCISISNLAKFSTSLNVKTKVTPNDFIYLIYTSGTTSVPKGVAIKHKGLYNYVTWRNKRYKISNKQNIIQLLNYSFDGYASNLFSSLSAGSTLLLLDDNDKINFQKIGRILINHNIEHLSVVPGIYEAILSAINDVCIPGLKSIVLAGEKTPKHLLEKSKKNNNKLLHINEYGPTEATIACTALVEIDSVDNIGYPIKNTRIHILNSTKQILPPEIPGEIFIEGVGLSLGYINKVSETYENFINSEICGTLLYKSNDLGRFTNNGSIEFLGRIDNQVKIRGYRIELGEIENQLLTHEEIKEALVIAKSKEGNKYLVCYYTSQKEISTSDLKSCLSYSLPDYMIPSFFVRIEAMPLTPNGKIDKKALPDFEVKAGNDYIAPSDELEDTLVEIWAEVLDIDKNEISINKSFFEIGGNSLLTVKVQQKLVQLDKFENITIPDLFKNHTIRMLAQSTQQGNLTKYKLQGKPQTDNHEIAIIGISGAFSGVKNIVEFWQLIKNKDEGIRFYSKEECAQLGVDVTSFENPNYIPVSGQVKDIELFDPLFWEISPNEAKLMDPQIRKFIEHCWFALEISGYIHQRKNLNIGVFAGSGNSYYFYNNVLRTASEINLWEASNANSKDALATKTSHILGLSGPSYSINTACSTGLVSVVTACENLQLGTCDMALAGGVSFDLPYQIGYTYQEGMIASKDGHCRTFDEDASGTTGGSGVGVVLLKRLRDAVKDNDNIVGVIKGYATNNDGSRKTSYTAPSVIGQAECIINAQRMAGVSSDEIDYVECHGTATNLGDPIEVLALKEAFKFNSFKGVKPKRKTILGAVKANIGHTDSAAGTAGLLKVCLMLQNKIIPGQPNFHTPNSKLNIDETNFEIAKENREWLPNFNRHRIAGVSAFGIGGTNAHVIIGDYIPDNNNKLANKESSPHTMVGQGESINYVFPISAKCKESLEFYKQELIKFLSNATENLCIGNIAYTLQEKREHFNYRSAYCAKNIDELIQGVKQDSSIRQVHTEFKNKIVFMFSGQGSQYPCMAKELYHTDQYFKTIIDKLISLANAYLDIDLYEVLFPKEGHIIYNINETRWAQISLFIIEYALAELLENLSIHPNAYIGHSIGEYVAATLSGVFTLEDAIKIVIARGKLMQSMQSGTMLAINAKEETICTIVETHKCEVAAINSIDDIVVSGNNSDINTLKTALDKKSISSVVLNTSHAYHSKMMEGAADEFEKLFSDIKLNKPGRIFISNLTGEKANEEVVTASYWCKQLRNTVQFAKGIDNLAKNFNHKISFIELGPGKGLSSFVTKYKNINNHKFIQSLHLLPSKGESIQTAKKLKNKEDILAKLWVSGIIEKPNDLKLFKQANTISNLPTYQFNYKKCWLEPNKGNDLNGQLKILPKEKWFYTPLWSAITNLNKTTNKKEVYKNALVFIRKDQLSTFDLTFLAKDIHFIVLDTNELQTEDISNSKLLFSCIKNEYDFKKIAEHLKNKSIEYDAIIHASSINNVTQLEDALSYSFYSLFLIHKYLLNVSYLKNVLVLTNDLAQITNEDIINPSNGTLVGAIRNINHEYPNIDARVIDIGHDKNYIEPFINQVVDDKLYEKSEELLAIRFGRLWKEDFERIDKSFSEHNLIEEDDVILITGGMGDVALSVAKYIANKHKVTFILVSRNDIFKDENPNDYIKQKIRLIEEIKATGSIVDIQSFDISDIHQVIELKDKIKNKYNSVHGIIHTAGVKPLTLDEYSLENVKNTFKGKVYGVYNIINIINLNKTKYIISTSSLASIMGDINRIEYCAANSYLDYLAVDKVRLKNIKTLSINLPGWLDISMMMKNSINIEKKIGQLQGIGKLLYLNAVNQKEGAELFYHLIDQSNYDQIIVSKLDIHDLKKELFVKEQTFTKDIQFTENAGSFTATEFKIAQIWNQILGVEEIGIHDNFFELGGNSLLATRVVSQIRHEFNIELQLKVLFEITTIMDLARLIDSNYKKAEIKQIEKNKEANFEQNITWSKEDNMVNEIKI